MLGFKHVNRYIFSWKVTPKWIENYNLGQKFSSDGKLQMCKIYHSIVSHLREVHVLNRAKEAQ